MLYSCPLDRATYRTECTFSTEYLYSQKSGPFYQYWGWKANMACFSGSSPLAHSLCMVRAQGWLPEDVIAATLPSFPYRFRPGAGVSTSAFAHWTTLFPSRIGPHDVVIFLNQVRLFFTAENHASRASPNLASSRASTIDV